ncbi:MAG: hypothetical protein ACLQMT_00865 [Candidatus Acidiferrales bacterium]
MLTIFSIPKPFKGHIGIIQRNAIRSWTLLDPRPEIILFGSEEGTAQLAHELGLRHFPEIACNEYGTPLLNDMFRQAEAMAGGDIMCYVNADILVLSDFPRALAHVTEQLKAFLAISERINLDVPQAIDFDAGWETAIKGRSKKTGIPVGYTGIDIFVFPKGTYPHVPDFGIGRLWFDQWLIKAARESGTPVVDLTRVAPVIHQNHDYSHVAGGVEWVWKGKEAEYNLHLYGAPPHSYTFLDVTHELTTGGAIRRVRFRRPLFETKRFFWDILVRRTAGARKALGFRRRVSETGPNESS